MLKSGAKTPLAPPEPLPVATLKIGRRGKVIPNSRSRPPRNRTCTFAGSWMTSAAVIAQLGVRGHPLGFVTEVARHCLELGISVDALHKWLRQGGPTAVNARAEEP